LSACGPQNAGPFPGKGIGILLLDKLIKSLNALLLAISTLCSHELGYADDVKRNKSIDIIKNVFLSTY